MLFEVQSEPVTTEREKNKMSAQVRIIMFHIKNFLFSFILIIFNNI